MSSLARGLYVAEPPQHYLVRPSLVVDCSVLAGLLFQEHWLVQAQARIEGHSLKAPWLLDHEIANVAVKKHRAGFTELAKEGLLAYADMDVERFETSPLDVYALATRYQLSAYDASYLWLAAELTCPLATFDEKLAIAAQAHLSSLP
ncbi:type II toxin-antitoxin system VapC family toxin [Rhodoferax sp.]|uniref:type II toxin-antitoxin system VapC family toxin n=1 Tax=Rhodoferax sp. TaxID=50421 RepID=UPI0025ED96AD|nr:type II toxin-antitoxin system VapC family toxin [Rhodoferax sp.]